MHSSSVLRKQKSTFPGSRTTIAKDVVRNAGPAVAHARRDALYLTRRLNACVHRSADLSYTRFHWTSPLVVALRLLEMLTSFQHNPRQSVNHEQLVQPCCLRLDSLRMNLRLTSDVAGRHETGEFGTPHLGHHVAGHSDERAS